MPKVKLVTIKPRIRMVQTNSMHPQTTVATGTPAPPTDRTHKSRARQVRAFLCLESHMPITEQKLLPLDEWRAGDGVAAYEAER